MLADHRKTWFQEINGFSTLTSSKKQKDTAPLSNTIQITLLRYVLIFGVLTLQT